VNYRFSGIVGFALGVALLLPLASATWANNCPQSFDNSVDLLIHAQTIANSTPGLSVSFRVVQVFERGPGWIEREFVAHSVPLGTVLASDPNVRLAMRQAARSLNEAFARTRDPFLAKLLRMFSRSPPSPNLHWDGKRIVLIDFG
jgi:hypothetical protein